MSVKAPSEEALRNISENVAAWHEWRYDATYWPCSEEWPMPKLGHACGGVSYTGNRTAVVDYRPASYAVRGIHSLVP